MWVVVVKGGDIREVRAAKLGVLGGSRVVRAALSIGMG